MIGPLCLQARVPAQGLDDAGTEHVLASFAPFFFFLLPLLSSLPSCQLMGLITQAWRMQSHHLPASPFSFCSLLPTPLLQAQLPLCTQGVPLNYPGVPHSSLPLPDVRTPARLPLQQAMQRPANSPLFTCNALLCGRRVGIWLMVEKGGGGRGGRGAVSDLSPAVSRLETDISCKHTLTLRGRTQGERQTPPPDHLGHPTHTHTTPLIACMHHHLINKADQQRGGKGC